MKTKEGKIGKERNRWDYQLQLFQLRPSQQVLALLVAHPISYSPNKSQIESQENLLHNFYIQHFVKTYLVLTKQQSFEA